MKPIRILLFIFSVVALLVAGWVFFPADGVEIGGLTLRYPSLAADLNETQEDVDVDAVMDNVKRSFEMSCSETLFDSLVFFRDYLKENPNRIYLPNDDYTYFDTLYALIEQAEAEGRPGSGARVHGLLDPAGAPPFGTVPRRGGHPAGNHHADAD